MNSEEVKGQGRHLRGFARASGSLSAWAAIPPSRLRRDTSLCTREAVKGVPLIRHGVPPCHLPPGGKAWRSLRLLLGEKLASEARLMRGRPPTAARLSKTTGSLVHKGANGQERFVLPPAGSRGDLPQGRKKGPLCEAVPSIFSFCFQAAWYIGVILITTSSLKTFC